jgi:hypothetical protein
MLKQELMVVVLLEKLTIADLQSEKVDAETTKELL